MQRAGTKDRPGESMFKTVCAMLVGFLVGCTGLPPQQGSGVCAQKPGSYACQVNEYENAGGG